MNDVTFALPSPAVRRPITQTMDRVRRWFRIRSCGLNGHTLYLDTTDASVWRERCTCGFTTPGIPVGGQHYQQKFAGDPSHHRLPKS